MRVVRLWRYGVVGFHVPVHGFVHIFGLDVNRKWLVNYFFLVYIRCSFLYFVSNFS